MRPAVFPPERISPAYPVLGKRASAPLGVIHQRLPRIAGRSSRTPAVRTMRRRWAAFASTVQAAQRSTPRKVTGLSRLRRHASHRPVTNWDADSTTTVVAARSTAATARRNLRQQCRQRLLSFAPLKGSVALLTTSAAPGRVATQTAKRSVVAEPAGQTARLDRVHSSWIENPGSISGGGNAGSSAPPTRDWKIPVSLPPKPTEVGCHCQLCFHQPGAAGLGLLAGDFQIPANC